MTYSIVARDPATGHLGLAVQTCWFAVGNVVGWAEAGVGAVATQSFAERAYGPRILARLGRGEAPEDALGAERAADPARATRQVGLVAADGRSAAFTGDACVPHAGDRHAPDVAVQANMMRGPGVPEAMAAAFDRAAGTLARRLLAALHAAEDAGGDGRGRQSAVLLVVDGERRPGRPWDGRIVDVRVDDHPAPLDELGRLLGIAEAYEHVDRALTAFDAGDAVAAVEAGAAARSLHPHDANVRFAEGLGLLAAGRADEAGAVLRALVADEPGWAGILGGFAARGHMGGMGEADVAALLRPPA